jgi:hypothetical protein
VQLAAFGAGSSYYGCEVICDVGAGDRVGTSSRRRALRAVAHVLIGARGRDAGNGLEPHANSEPAIARTVWTAQAVRLVCGCAGVESRSLVRVPWSYSVVPTLFSALLGHPGAGALRLVPSRLHNFCCDRVAGLTARPDAMPTR